MRIPDPAFLHSRSTARYSGPFSFRPIAVHASSILAVLVFLACSVAPTRAQWQSFDRPSERFRALAADDSLVYALSSPYALYGSENRGGSWYSLACRVSVACEGFSVGILNGTRIGGSSNGTYVQGWGSTPSVRQAVAGVTDDILAVSSTRRGTLSTWYLGGFGGGVRRSTNGGNAWALCNEGLTDLNVTSLVAIAAPGDSSQVLFAGTYGGGVFRSDDDGLHWTNTSAGLDDLHVYALIAHGDTLYTAHSGGRVSRSTSAGSTWSTLGTGLPYTDVLCLARMTSSAEGEIFAGTIDSGVWRYAPASGQWEPMNTGVKSMRINAIIAHDDVLLLGTDRGLYRSTNHGAAWQSADNGAIPGVHAVHATTIAPGTPGTRIFTESDPHYALSEGYRGQGSGPSCKVRWTDDFGATWTTIPFFTESVATVIHDACILVFKTASRDSDVLRCILSTDRGTTWGDEIHFYGPLYCGVTGLVIRDVPAERRFDIYFTAAGGPTPGLFRSSDSTRTWSTVKYPAGGLISAPLLATDSLIYAACQTSALVSADGGATWTPVTYDGVYTHSPPPGTLNQMPMLRLMHASGPMLYASVAPNIVPGNPGGLYASTDRGTTWTPAGFTGLIVDRIIEADSILFALQGGHIFAALASVLDWKDVSGDLAADTLDLLTASSEYVVTLTRARDRIWYRPMTEIRDELSSIGPTATRSNVSEIPITVALHQNYPNPFNPTTTIGYELPALTHVKLSVFDLLGREVSALVDERKAAGRYEVRFDASALSSGVYFYRLATAGRVETRRMYVVR